MSKLIKNIYGKLRKIFPNKTKGHITKSLYTMGIKPTVNKKAKSPFTKGIVVLSADFEMAWAFRFSKTVEDPEKKGIQERINIPLIINLLDKHNIPVTWAVVGHLFLDKCSAIKGLIHNDMPRPDHFNNRNWKFEDGDWYQHDPGSNYQQDSAWYAPDLIELILKSKVNHEIGCHTFSHIDFTYKNCPQYLAQKELSKCKVLASKKNINLRSMVFPGGTLGNFETLKREGFICYRNPNGTYDVDIPLIDKNGLVAISSSIGLDKPAYNWNNETCISIVKKHIDSAEKYKLVSHLWFHPSMDQWYLKNVFPFILEYLNKRRKEGKIKIMTMGELANMILNGNIKDKKIKKNQV